MTTAIRTTRDSGAVLIEVGATPADFKARVAALHDEWFAHDVARLELLRDGAPVESAEWRAKGTPDAFFAAKGR